MIVKGFIVPGKPHPLLAPEKNAGWKALRTAFDEVRRDIEKIKPDLIVIYSSQWPSIIGHQIQTDPNPKWVHVDQEFHHLGAIPYEFKMDSIFGQALEGKAQKRGLQARTVAYKGFPIDTGTVVALKLIDPNSKYPASVISCNMYADRSETIVLGKATRDAIYSQSKRTVVIAVTSFSHRMFSKQIDPKEDRIYSSKDDEWNRKILEMLKSGRLEDVSQLAREFSAQASGDQKMKAIWWLAATMGQHNQYDGAVLEYQPINGTGAALVSLTPSQKLGLEREFDEEDSEVFQGHSGVLKSQEPAPVVIPEKSLSDAPVFSKKAPKPVGAYPHARKVGNLLFLSGVGPRQPEDNSIPGGPVRDKNGQPQNYDVELQTRAVIENVRRILEEAGSSLEKVFDITVYLVDMDRDFAIYNKVYAEYFTDIQATRTTLAINALPTPIAVEFKVIATL